MLYYVIEPFKVYPKGGVNMNEKSCKQCKFFKKHYIIKKKEYVETGFGHCSKGELKHKRPDSVACADFSEKQLTEENILK